MTQQRIQNNKIQLFTDSKETARQIQEEFSVHVPGYENNIRYRSGQWDGKHKFYTLKRQEQGWLFEIPIGFKGRVEDFTKESFGSRVNYNKALSFLKEQIPKLPFKPYKHQMKAFVGLASNKSHLASAATGSGKSLILYLLIEFYRKYNLKILVLVPTIDLTQQLKGDFKDYNASDAFLNNIQIIGGQFKSKDIKKDVVISTWQSAVKADLKSFDVVLNDECHLSKAEVLLEILKNPFKIKLGLTGTVPIDKLDFMLLEQNFGKPVTYINARGLIDLGLATDVTIVPMFLQQKVKVMKYTDEVKYIKTDKVRNTFIAKFMKKLTGLSIGLYNHTEHGKYIWELLTGEKLTTKMMNDFIAQKRLGVFFMSGSMKQTTRKQILDYFKTLSNDNVIMIGQSKILSTGINIKPLKNLVFLASNKSYTQTIQSIGRVLRLHNSKSHAVVYDMIDDFSSNRKTENYALRHFWNRLSFYRYQDFEIVEKEIHLT